MTVLAHIADRVLNRPLLLTPDKASVIVNVLAGRMGLSETFDASRFVGEATEIDATGRGRALPYRRTAEGVAIISITGSLVNRGAFIGSSSGLQSYEGIRFQLGEAKRDPKVSAVILDLQTPGGEAVGAFETAAAVRELSAAKRTVAVVNGMAASAGYAIASGATEIVTTETGVSGSIGVIMVHADFSRQLDKSGVSPTVIFAGAHKADGNPFEPLSAEVRQDLQAEVNALYDAFLGTVSKGRGSRLTMPAARQTEARTFIGSKAVKAGLADRVGTFEIVLAELSSVRSGRSTVQNRRSKMDENEGAGLSDAAQARQDAVARIKAVMMSEEGKKSPNLAQHLAYETDMSAEVALGILGAAATDKTAPRTPSIAERMAGDKPLPNGSTMPRDYGASIDHQFSAERAPDLAAAMKARHAGK